ncbi:SH3 domain-containing protein [Streptomyces sp. NPDC001922]|uniref:SH3 domain-containing protein n=1 Tax=Streptomyces sp. NPDC001922 TaxID=3364624 RepID=UPI00367F5C0C
MRRTALALSTVALLGLGAAAAVPANAAEHATTAQAAPASAASAAASNYWDGRNWTVGTNGARLRTKPSTSGSVKGQLYENDEIKILKHGKKWDHIKLTAKSRGGLAKGTSGYIATSSLNIPTCFPEDMGPCNAW